MKTIIRSLTDYYFHDVSENLAKCYKGNVELFMEISFDSWRLFSRFFQLSNESPGVTSLLSHLLGCGTDTTFDERVNSLVDIGRTMMSLPVTAQKEMSENCSRSV